VTRTRTLLVLLCMAGPLGSVAADPPTEALDVQQVVSTMTAGREGGPGPGEAPPFPKFEDVTKGMKSDTGLFTLWYYPPDAKDKDGEKLLCQIPVKFLGEQFMLSTSYSGGGFFTGFPLDERVVRWELLDRQLLLVEPETRYVVDKAKEVSDVVRRTYPERIRVAVPVLTKSPQGDPVIDLGPLLKSNFADIAWTAAGAGRMGGELINPQLSKWTKKKTFELNVEIGVELAVARSSPPGSFDKKMVHYSFWKLPQTDYQPRVADDRVGYFLTVNQDWSKPADERDIFNRYINRWHLVKRDPSLPVCEPKQPIIFYIEKTVPVRYRRAVRDGILEWNKAFEKIGFINAIEVRQQTDDNEWKDLDPEDMRYSFIRWIVTGGGFAMGPSRVNPFTGQIYDADIVFDDSMVRYFQQEAERMLPTTGAADKLSDPTLQDFLKRYPQWARSLPNWEQTIGPQEDESELRHLLRERLRQRGHPPCDYCEGMKHQMLLAQTVLADQPPEVKERFLYDVIKEVVTHEVGHTLGLRHNFMGSSVYSLEEIQRRRTTGEPTCGSIMDYNPVLFFAHKPTEGHFITPTIGPYDYWAIEYGYRPFDETYKPAAKKVETDEKAPELKEGGEPGAPAASAPGEAQAGSTPVPELAQIPPEVLAQIPTDVKKLLESGKPGGLDAAGRSQPPGGKSGGARSTPAAPSGERAMLLEIAKRATEPELAYATDEDTMYTSPDPRTNRFDMGADPVDWARTRIELVNERISKILEWGVKDAESWYHLRPAFTALMVEKATVLDYVGRYIGGQYFSRAHRGDPNAPPPFRLVEPQRQRAALAFIEENLFSDQFFSVPPEVLNHLAPSRWWHEGMRISFNMDYPIHSLVATLQWWQLSDRLFPNTIRRIYDAELKTAETDKLTAAEYLRRIQHACWSDAVDVDRLKSRQWSDANPFLSSFRRSLQREYLGLAEPLVRQPPGEMLPADLHAMVHYMLERLSSDLGNALEAGQGCLDFASRAHLSACKSRIDRMLSSELREYGTP